MRSFRSAALKELEQVKTDFRRRMDDALIVNEQRLDEIVHLRAALLVLVKTVHIRTYLEVHDPKALEQVLAALGTCPECGQGPSYQKAYEHKSTCRWWRDESDED